MRELVQQKDFDLPLDAAVFKDQERFEAQEAAAGGGTAPTEEYGDDDGRAALEFFREKNITEKGFDASSYFTYVQGLMAHAGDTTAENTSMDKAHDNFWYRFLTKWDHVEHTVLPPSLLLEECAADLNLQHCGHRPAVLPFMSVLLSDPSFDATPRTPGSSKGGPEPLWRNGRKDSGTRGG